MSEVLCGRCKLPAKGYAVIDGTRYCYEGDTTCYEAETKEREVVTSMGEAMKSVLGSLFPSSNLS